MSIPAAAVTRFAEDLAALAPPAGGVGLAVSGGPDSLALLLLAHAVLGSPAIRVATVDHGLRAEAAAEAGGVAAICASIGVAHDTLTADWPSMPTANIQSAAREARYELLDRWAQSHGLHAVLTGHHADDQAETLLMRLARGSGASGLAGARARSQLPGGTWRLRPLLGWRRSALAEIVSAAGLTPVEDPANTDDRFDRTRVRALLAAQGWADPLRLAASASHLADAEEALQFVTEALIERRIAGPDVDPSGLPRELRRRLLVAGLERFGASRLRGPDVDRLLAALDAGRSGTLGGVKADPGPPWHLSKAPAHRRY